MDGHTTDPTVLGIVLLKGAALAQDVKGVQALVHRHERAGLAGLQQQHYTVRMWRAAAWAHERERALTWRRQHVRSSSALNSTSSGGIEIGSTGCPTSRLRASAACACAF